ncbi:MAG: DUF4159 domain-containing protein [Candidatus Muiribacteriota bacterium]
MRNKKTYMIFIFIFFTYTIFSLQIARLQYDGGGDWYNDPDVIPNLTSYFNKHAGTTFKNEEAVVTLRDPELAKYPFLYMTGHGNVSFSTRELETLRAYLKAGGFIYIDDDYGMDEYIRPILFDLFKNKELHRIYPDHEIYRSFFNFEKLPKIHEHDGKPPEMWGIFIEDRLALVYTYETNISDGWAGHDVHQTPSDIREEALKFGMNIYYYAITN